MANNQAPTGMSTNMNMTVTIFGFVLSALFMFVICCRLLCFRFRQASTLEALQQSARRSALAEQNRQGLQASAVALFPTIKYDKPIFVSHEDNSCTICLGDYSEKEILRLLPRCGHAFHVACIDAWLRQHFTCPVCRISLRIFPEWGQLRSSLLSLSVKPRFNPGVLPDSMFEQPTAAFPSKPISNTRGLLVKEGSDHSTPLRPTPMGGKKEVGESSVQAGTDHLLIPMPDAVSPHSSDTQKQLQRLTPVQQSNSMP